MGWLKQQRLRRGSPDAKRAAAQELAGESDPRALEALIAALRDESKDVRATVMWALLVRGELQGLEAMLSLCDTSSRGIGREVLGAVQYVGAAAVEPMIAALGSVHSRVRRSAAEMLGRLGDPRATEALVQALSDADASVRIWAARSLGLLRDRRAAQPLIRALSDVNREVQDSACQSLSELGYGAVEPLTDLLLYCPDAVLRGRAADAMRRIGTDYVAARLVTVLESRYPDARVLAREVLSDLKRPSCRDALLEALRSGSQEVREAAARILEAHDYTPEEPDVRAAFHAALGRHGTAAREGDHALEPLLVALRQAQPDEQEDAAKSLGRISHPASIEALVEALWNPHGCVRAAAALSLQRLGWTPDRPDQRAAMLAARGEFAEAGALGGPALRSLEVASRDPSPALRAAAAEALGRTGEPRAVAALLDMLGDERSGPDARVAATRALGELGDPRAVDVLLDALGDTLTRPAAAQALGRLGLPEAVPGLWGLLQDPDDTVRREAAGALGRIGDTRAVDGLTRLLSDPSARVRASAVAALGAIGDASAFEALRRCLSDPTGLVQATADEALGALGDARAVGVLVDRAGRPESCRSAVDGLKRLLADHRRALPAEDVARLSVLPDLIATALVQRSVTGDAEHARRIDCSEIRHAAAVELGLRREELDTHLPAIKSVNLERWRLSREPEAWVQERANGWTHDDWTALIDRLSHTALWPMDVEEIGKVLEEVRASHVATHEG